MRKARRSSTIWFAGRIRHTAVLDRSTPYHFPHVTDVAGEAFVYGGDDRYVNNLFLAVDDSAKPLCTADAAGAAGRRKLEPRSLTAIRARLRSMNS